MISEIYAKFITEQKYRNNTGKTIEWYKENLEDFFFWLKSDDPSSLTLDNFKLYGVYLRESVKRNGDKLSDASVQNALRAIKAFYNFCIENGYIEDISKYLKLPKAHYKIQEILDNEEIDTLLSCFSESTKTGLRNKCLVVLMLDSGLRRGEILRLNIGDVHLKLDKPSLIVKGKGGRQRIVPMGLMSTSLLSKYIGLYRKTAGLNEPLFLSSHNRRCSDNLIKQLFKRLKKQSGMPRLHPHLLRHTFATYYIADGGDLETLRLILGHANIQTTQRYLHMAATLALQTSRHTSHLDKLYR